MSTLSRFLKYIQIDSPSDPKSGKIPSSDIQLNVAKCLEEEMNALGLENVHIKDGTIYGILPATPGYEGKQPVGFIAHMDTAPEFNGFGVKPQIIENYDGGDVLLKGSGHVLSVRDFPALKELKGQKLITTDGTTLLGADDKAGIAEIMQAVERVIEEKIPHGKIAIAFTPDEEIGSGADLLNLDAFRAKEAYTVDGGEIGEIEYENFNAASAHVVIHGVNIHPGSGKNRMKNAVLLASEFISMLPPAETPAHTEGYEGFYHVSDICGNESRAELKMLVRDHDRASFERRRAFLMNLCEYLNGVHGAGTFELTVKDSYYNMKEKSQPHMHLIENAASAMRACGVTPKVVPIRGGTDGARLSFRGLPCPNLCTGGVNFHSIHEFIPVFALETMTRVLVTIAEGEFAK